MKTFCLAIIFILDAWTKSAGLTILRDNYCGIEWRAFNGTCYYANDRYSHLLYTHAGAADQCQRLNAKLVKIDSQQTLNNIRQLDTRRNRIWLDLYRNVETGRWQWGDKTTFVESSFLKWNAEPESAATYHTACVGLTTQGTLAARSCWSRYGYICSLNATGGRCPSKFRRSGSVCYYMSNLTDVTQLTNMVFAGSRCARMASGARLVELNDRQTMTSLLTMIPRGLQSAMLWYTRMRLKGGVWSGGKIGRHLLIPQSNKWAQEPDNLGGAENCAALYVKTGRLMDVPCSFSNLHGTVCQKPNKLPLFSPFNGQFGCGKAGWVRGGMSCYYAIDSKMQTWDAADRDCKSMGAHLLRIDSAIERQWFAEAFPYSFGWTDLCHVNGRWQWSDGKQADPKSLKWREEPVSGGYNHGACAAISDWGDFYSQDCIIPNYYICEFRAKGKADCPGGWSYFNRSCYFVNYANQTSWRNAKFQCQTDAGSKGGYLFVPYYKGEVDFVKMTFLKKLRRNNTITFFWTGLTDDNTGVWGFQHNTIVQPIDTTHIEWLKSPSLVKFANEIGRVCALTQGGLLEDGVDWMTINPICERSLQTTVRVGPNTGESRVTSCWPTVLLCVAMVIGLTKLLGSDVNTVLFNDVTLSSF